ncbi:hypothetical protein BH10PSE12_BH10PSE12_32400 [soil metagenome]
MCEQGHANHCGNLQRNQSQQDIRKRFVQAFTTFTLHGGACLDDWVNGAEAENTNGKRPPKLPRLDMVPAYKTVG